eukprot:TRINITY_DN124301_c1_g1_i1.p1 TRINITY_DN124301_c1_g1~~TRINITY_DN124301_c1_g1_i1.p1  ORF type:complete len:110 (-),score=11.25 TRINITY_DN124301_c1_g1_i1:3-302(-)
MAIEWGSKYVLRVNLMSLDRAFITRTVPDWTLAHFTGEEVLPGFHRWSCQGVQVSRRTVPGHLRQGALQVRRWVSDGLGLEGKAAVSYTHLTLPTIYSV